MTKVAGEREKGRGGLGLQGRAQGRDHGRGRPAGPFGTGRRLKGGQTVTWFWCELKATGSCQRTLEARPDRTSAAPGETLRVTVRGYDDQGKGVAVEGATVRLGSASAVTGAGGVAMLTVTGSGGQRLQAERSGMVRAFPRVVAVG